MKLDKSKLMRNYAFYFQPPNSRHIMNSATNEGGQKGDMP